MPWGLENKSVTFSVTFSVSHLFGHLFDHRHLFDHLFETLVGSHPNLTELADFGDCLIRGLRSLLTAEAR